MKKKKEVKKEFVFEGDVRIGNYAVAKEKDEITGWDIIVVRAISGFWEVRYRCDNEMYGVIDMLVKDEGMHKVLEMMINTMYISCSTIGDRAFYEGFARIYTLLTERLQKPTTAEEDDANLQFVKEMRVADDMLKEIEES